MKDKLAIAAVVAVMSTGVGFAFGAASSPDSAGARGATLNDVVAELKKIARYTEETCDAVGGKYPAC